MRALIFLFLLVLLGQSSYAQMGCTDPQALNYNVDAVTNDGSCNYGLTEYSMTELAILPESLKECSGIEFIASGLWAHNDGGDEDKIYRIDSMSGAVLQSVIIATGDNLDWEGITEDENHLYIGDFGNNLGNRTDLRVYKVAKSDLSNNIVNAELIEFSYADQTDFSENENDNDFDCEAFIFYNDSLHLFTKNWINNETKHYVLPATAGLHTAEFVEAFDVEGLITGVDVSENGEIVLIGYTEVGVNFMWLLFDYHNTQFFSGNKRKISLGTGLTNSQTEGITFRGDGYGYVCSEQFRVNDQIIFSQKLFSFSIKQWLENTTSVSELDVSYEINAYPNPFQDFVDVQLSKEVDKWRLYSESGVFLKQASLINNQLNFRLKTNNLEAGTFYLELIKDGKSKVISLIKY